MQQLLCWLGTLQLTSSPKVTAGPSPHPEPGNPKAVWPALRAGTHGISASSCPGSEDFPSAGHTRLSFKCQLTTYPTAAAPLPLATPLFHFLHAFFTQGGELPTGLTG